MLFDFTTKEGREEFVKNRKKWVGTGFSDGSTSFTPEGEKAYQDFIDGKITFEELGDLIK